MLIQSEQVIIHAINHRIRRKILELLISKPKTFSELLNHFDISTGKLMYHLNQINGFIAKNSKNTYELTPLGKKALEIIEIIRSKVTENDQRYIKKAYLSQKNDSKMLILKLINFGIRGLAFIIIITIFLLVYFLSDPNAPTIIIIWPIIIPLLVGEFLILIWLEQIKKSAPLSIEPFAKHLQGND